MNLLNEARERFRALTDLLPQWELTPCGASYFAPSRKIAGHRYAIVPVWQMSSTGQSDTFPWCFTDNLFSSTANTQVIIGFRVTYGDFETPVSFSPVFPGSLGGLEAAKRYAEGLGDEVSVNDLPSMAS